MGSMTVYEQIKPKISPEFCTKLVDDIQKYCRDFLMFIKMATWFKLIGKKVLKGVVFDAPPLHFGLVMVDKQWHSAMCCVLIFFWGCIYPILQSAKEEIIFLCYVLMPTTLGFKDSVVFCMFFETLLFFLLKLFVAQKEQFRGIIKAKYYHEIHSHYESI